MEKEQARQRALRQMRLEQLTSRNLEITQELETLRSNNPNRRKYTLMVGISTIFIYFLVIILAVSLIVGGSLYYMFTFFLGWTILFLFAVIWLSFHIRKLRKLDAALIEQTKDYWEELHKNSAEILSLQQG